MRFKTNLTPSSSLINMTPLVDVVFLLLIFFIVTSDILPLKSLQISPPELPQDSTPLTTQLFVVVDKHSVIYLGSKKRIVDLESLEGEVKKEVSFFETHHQGVKPTIVLNMDRSIDYGTFLKLFHSLGQCGCRVRLMYQYEEVV